MTLKNTKSLIHILNHYLNLRYLTILPSLKSLTNLRIPNILSLPLELGSETNNSIGSVESKSIKNLPDLIYIMAIVLGIKTS